MRSPDEYEAAFYADTTNANLDTTVKVGNPTSAHLEVARNNNPENHNLLTGRVSHTSATVTSD
jgi:hypothetical protein